MNYIIQYPEKNPNYAGHISYNITILRHNIHTIRDQYFRPHMPFIITGIKETNFQFLQKKHNATFVYIFSVVKRF